MSMPFDVSVLHGSGNICGPSARVVTGPSAQIAGSGRSNVACAPANTKMQPKRSITGRQSCGVPGSAAPSLPMNCPSGAMMR